MSLNEKQLDLVQEVSVKVIDKLRAASKNNILLTKKEVKNKSVRLYSILLKKGEESQFETKLTKYLTKKNDEYMSVLLTMKEMIPFLAKQTVKRFENGNLASVFSENEVVSLANKKMLDVLARYRKGLVDMKGLKSYFKTAFKNHSQKVYASHNETVIRGGIKTVSSDEAMNVAINMNLYNPEKKYIVNNSMNHILSFLRNHDLEYNQKIQKFNQESSYKQNYAGIISGLLMGNTAEETCTELGMLNSDYLRQKRLCFEFLKKEIPEQLKDLFSEFEHEEDKRIHVQSVEKKSRRGKERNDVRSSFVLQEKKSGSHTEVNLLVYLTVVDYNGNSVNPPKNSQLKNVKTIILDSKKTTKNNISKVKNNFMEASKTDIIKAHVKKESELFLNEYSQALNQYYGSKQENAA